MKSVGFVDTSRFKSGVSFDPKNGIIHIALIKNKEINKKALKKAVQDAGFKPVSLYQLKKGNLVQESL